MNLKKIVAFFKKEEVKKFLKDNLDFVKVTVVYGFVINYMLWGIFKIPFVFYRAPAYGLLAYFIKEEFVRLIRRIKAR